MKLTKNKKTRVQEEVKVEVLPVKEKKKYLSLKLKRV